MYSIVLRFRTYQIAFTADIAKIYQQVRIHEDDRKLWKKFAEVPLRTYELSMVTYGTASVPNLATRCVQRLAENKSKEFSLAPETLINNFYVDDALCRANTIEDALRLQQELIALLGRWGISPTQVLCQSPQHIRRRTF